MRVSIASTGRESPDHRDQKASDQEYTHNDRGVIGVKTHHQSFSASYRAADPVRSKKDERGTPLAWSGVPPPASASEDAKERGPQLPPSLAHPEPRPNSAVWAVINFGLAHPATTILTGQVARPSL